MENIHIQSLLEKLQLSDRYRNYLYGESEKETVWRHGSAPKYDLVNNLFEYERTKEWEQGSLEETVQNLVKSWEMELTHKIRLQDFKTVDHANFTLSVNGSKELKPDEVLRMGSYNALLASVEDGDNPLYTSSKETFESSHDIFRGVFPGGFAWEVLEVYSGPPIVAFKWRHWGKMDGKFKEYKCNGKLVEIFGIAIAQVNSELKIGRLEVFYDPSQLLTQLAKNVDGGCPFASKSS